MTDLSTKTDAEIALLTAKAMGLGNPKIYDGMNVNVDSPRMYGNRARFDPLNDDADAMRVHEWLEANTVTITQDHNTVKRYLVGWTQTNGVMKTLVHESNATSKRVRCECAIRLGRALGGD